MNNLVPKIRINPSLEALCFDQTLAVFTGDRSLVFRGQDNTSFLDRIRKIFDSPRSESEIKKLDTDIYGLLPQLLSTEVLIKDVEPCSVSFYGTGQIMQALQEMIEETNGGARSDTPLLVCIPDNGGLAIQKEALKKLEPGHSLLLGMSRGTSVFVCPLIADTKTDVFKLFFRMISTEVGIGNSYLLNELSNESNSPSYKKNMELRLAKWIASDIFALLKNGRLNTQTARIYRGSFVLREDVPFTDTAVTISSESTIYEINEALISMFVGTGKIIGRFSEYIMGNKEAITFAARAEMAWPQLLHLQKESDLDTWGTGNSPAMAKLAALMEALERYFIRSYSMNDFPLCSRNSVQQPILDRMTIAGYGLHDTYSDDLSPDVPRRWVPVRRLKDNEMFLAPLEFIHYPVPLAEAQYVPSDEITSSGVAAHFSRDLAIISACHELVERDAFLIAWLRKASPPLINHTTLPERVRRQIYFLSQQGWELQLMNLTTDLAPVICALLSRESELDRHAFGAASKDDPEEACLKAISEAQINFSLFQAKPRAAKKVLQELTGPKDHLELYAKGDHDDILMSFFGHEADYNFADIKAFSGNIVERIQNNGMDIFVADLKNADVEKLAPNIHVVRAIVPDLVPIYFGKNWARTGSPRIKIIPEKMGWVVKAKDELEYQLFPHPFP